MAHLLHHYLTESARRYPTRPAVEWRGTVLTYRELDDQSTRLAHLLAARGIGRGTRVGLYLPKSIQSIVAMHGILKTGATYVPCDSNQPARRVAYILGNCGVKGLITASRKLAALGEVLPELTALETVVLTDDPGATVPEAGPARVHRWEELERVTATTPLSDLGVEIDPAYLLYTSGSTGNPKGVILSHRNAMAFVDWGAETFQVRSEDRLSNHAPHHFDLSVFDIYVALKAGACVVLVPDEVAPFPPALAKWMADEEITVWYSVPSALIRLLLHGDLGQFPCDRLRTVLYAGEVFPVKYLREVMNRLPKASFYNLYGPTETNVCTYYDVPRPLPPEMADIPIGRACANTEVFAVDDAGAVAGPGGTGELYVRGPTVLLGYWGDPEKTARMLVKNPFQSAYQEWAYRTGDLVRLGADGNYTFIGRKDHMVKSRGYRIELGEIEQVLYQHPQVKEAVVIPVPDEEVGARLEAVVVSHENGELTKPKLQAFCLERLPRYMVPEAFLFLDELPRTSTGKADRVALAKSLVES